MKVILRNYFLLVIFLWIFSLIQLAVSDLYFNKSIFFINLLTILIYTIIINKSLSFSESKFNSNFLFYIVLIYSLISVFIYKIIYYEHHGDYFIIGALDAKNYSSAVLSHLDKPFFELISTLSRQYVLSDMGALLYIAIIYKIIPSTLLVDVVAVVLGALSAKALFVLGSFFMSRKYAFFCSLAYFCSSFITQFESSGLKEPIFVYIVILTYLYYYKYVQTKKTQYLILLSLLAICILLFRPSVLFFVALSIGSGIILQRKQNTKNVVLVFIVLFVSVYQMSEVESVLNQFSSFDKSVSLRSDIVKTSGENTAIAAAFVSSLIGPLPTILPVEGKEIISLSSIGLVFRVLMSIPFWLGVISIFQTRNSNIYPFIVLVLVEMSSLIYIMESYELRYHLIHFPFIYLISFFYIYQLSLSEKYKILKVKQLINLSSIGLFIIIIYWNMRLL